MTPIRPDFQTALDSRLNGLSIKPKGLSEDTKTKLAKLQGTAEELEAVFTKALLEQMQKVRFSTEGDGEMGNLAKDLGNQAVAQAIAKRGPGMGLAKMIFVETAVPVIRQAMTEAGNGMKTKERT